MNVILMVVSSLILVLGVVILGYFLAAINTSVLSASVVSIINLIPLVLVGGGMIGILVGAFSGGRF
jgi:hypothetical protein